MSILSKFEITVTSADIAEVERLIVVVNEHNEEMGKWIKEG